MRFLIYIKWPYPISFYICVGKIYDISKDIWFRQGISLACGEGLQHQIKWYENERNQQNYYN